MRVEKLEGELSFDTARVAASFAARDYVETLQDRAFRATRFLRPRTGTLREPEKAYLRMRLDAYIGTFSVPNGWDWSGIESDEHAQSVMLLAASQTIYGKRVFVGLIGSAHNLIQDGVHAPIKPTQGRTPSNVQGLYDLFSQIRENQDARPDDYVLGLDRSLDDLSIAREAMGLAQGSPGDGPPRRVELLMQRHLHPITGEVRLDQHFLDPYNLVLIGAPLWIREVTSSDGALSFPLMDHLGRDEHQVFNEARQKSLWLVERALSANAEVTALGDELKARDKTPKQQIHADSRLEQLVDLSADTLVARMKEALAARGSAIKELNDHETETAEMASGENQWPHFAEWYSLQASLQGIPFVSLEVERAPGWWRRLFRRGRDDRTPEQTTISGLVVTIFPRTSSGHSPRMLELGFYRDAQTRDLTAGYPPRVRHVLVTPTGEIYPVTIWTYRWKDPRARVVYKNQGAEKDGLRSWEDPEPSPGLIPDAVEAMLEEAMRWRVTLKRRIPESPWLYDPNLLLHSPHLRENGGLQPPHDVHLPRIDEMIEAATVDVDLDAESSFEPDEGEAGENEIPRQESG